MQRRPLLRSVDQTRFFLGSGTARKRAWRAVLGLFMLFLQRLDPAGQVSAGANQVLLGIIQFVLIEIQVCFGLNQVRFQRLLFAGGSFLHLLGKLLGVFLIISEKFFGLLHSLLALFRF